MVSARAVSADGHVEALPSGLRPWLTSTLQLDPRSAFASAIEARAELEKVFDRNDDLGAPSALEAFLARYRERIEITVDSAPQASAKVPVSPEPVVSAPVGQIVSEPEPPAPEPVASEPPWPETRHAIAQEPLRHQAIGLEPLVAASLRREWQDPPSLGSKLRPSVELYTRRRHTRRSPHMRDRCMKATRQRSRLTWHRDAKAGVAARRSLQSCSCCWPAVGRWQRAGICSAVPVTTGTVVVTTNPPGAQVFIDGVPQGASPTTLTVAAGSHVLELRGGGDPRTMSLDVAAGAQLSQYIEMAKGPLAAGSLQVRTEPAGAKVSVDGVARGASPVIVADLTPGEHTVVVEGENGSTTKQTVTVEAGATASLVANLPASQGVAASAGGWISVSTPKTVQLFEAGRLLGSSDSERLMVQAGSHQLEIVNDALGYRSSRSVQVSPGKVSRDQD